jgi:hypothetical protein
MCCFLQYKILRKGVFLMGKNTSIFNKLQKEKEGAKAAQVAGDLKRANQCVTSINSCRSKLKLAGCNSRNSDIARRLSFIADNLKETREYVRAEIEKKSQGKKTRSKTRELDASCREFEKKLKRANMPTNPYSLKKLLERVEKNQSYESKKTGRVRSDNRSNPGKLNIKYDELPDGQIIVSADYDTKFGEFIDNPGGLVGSKYYNEFVELKKAGDESFAQSS